MTALIEVEQVDTRDGIMFVAHGPNGHRWLLKRLTRAAAEADGLAYFLATRERDPLGNWVIAH